MMRRILLSAACLIAVPAWAQDVAPAPSKSGADDSAFELGKIVVTGYRSVDAAIESDRVGQEAIYRFDRRTLDDTASLIPGVVASNSGGHATSGCCSCAGSTGSRCRCPSTASASTCPPTTGSIMGAS
jgi:hypothetical protein